MKQIFLIGKDLSSMNLLKDLTFNSARNLTNGTNFQPESIINDIYGDLMSLHEKM